MDKLEDHADDLFRRMPDGWMSSLAMAFATAMIHYSIGQLREVLQ